MLTCCALRCSQPDTMCCMLHSVKPPSTLCPRLLSSRLSSIMSGTLQAYPTSVSRNYYNQCDVSGGYRRTWRLGGLTLPQSSHLFGGACPGDGACDPACALGRSHPIRCGLRAQPARHRARGWDGHDGHERAVGMAPEADGTCTTGAVLNIMVS
jgi:hypothetical protein